MRDRCSWVSERADELVNPRPAHCDSMQTRDELHTQLVAKGVAMDIAGEWEAAEAAFIQAYPLLFRSSTLLCLIDMKLKLGECEVHDRTSVHTRTID